MKSSWCHARWCHAIRPGVVLALSILPGCSLHVESPHGSSLRPPGRLEEPDLATDSDGQLVGAWALVDDRGNADVVVSRFVAREGIWAPPRRANPSPGSAVAGRQVGPRIVVLPSGAVAVAWVDRGRDPAGDIVLATSEDGRTFSPPRRVNDDVAVGTGQEYHDIAVTPAGELCVVWLDERDAPADYPNQKQVYFTTSRDGGLSFAPSRALTASPHGVCPCCRPALATGVDGSVHIIYRDRDGDSLFIRSLSRRRGDEEFDLPVTLSDGWQFPGCPVNGPAIATGTDLRVWTLWVEDGGHLRWARSDDGARTFSVTGTVEATGGPLAGGASNLGLAAAPGLGAVATWVNAAGRVCVAQLPDRGDELPWRPQAISPSGALARCPSVVAPGGVVTACWIEDSLEYLVTKKPPPPVGERRLGGGLGGHNLGGYLGSSTPSGSHTMSAGSSPSKKR